MMLFNTGRDYDFMPKLSVNNAEVLEVVEEFKLLWVKIQSDLKRQENINFICKKVYERVWMIRRLKSLGANTTEMLDVYEKQVRSILELAVPVWNANLTQSEEKQIERVQKTAYYVILGHEYLNYEQGLSTLGGERLSVRRTALSLNFAKKALKSEKYKNWFSPAIPVLRPRPNTRAPIPEPSKLKDVPYRTARYRDSPLPYLTRLLNED